MNQTILVTGGCGFIGSNFLRWAVHNTEETHFINLDSLTYSGNLENLKDLEQTPRYQFVRGDIGNSKLLDELMTRCDAVIHFAAESHVDRSIMDCSPFILTNIMGTQTLLDAVRRNGGKRFIHVSTDEVYGHLPLDRPDLKFTEDTPVQPRSPYAASKAASDMVVQSYHHTFGMEVVITRCSNNFGPYQFPEKVIPLFITNLLEGKKVPLYGDGLNVRDWIHVEDHCSGIFAAFERGRSGQTYNFGGNNERSNLELTRLILQIMGHGEDMIQPVKDRPGHDRRYAIDPTKALAELGWQPMCSAWPQALEETVKWYVDHTDWWRRVRSGAYRDYYDRQYA